MHITVRCNFFFQAEDGIRDRNVTGVQTCALPILIVSFVNSGLMQLGQTAGILMGANIGGTVTGQLIAFDLASIAPLFVMAGVLMVVFEIGRASCREKV